MTDNTERTAPPVPKNPIVSCDPADTLVDAANVLRAVAKFHLEGCMSAHDPENCGLWKILQCVYEALDYESARIYYERNREPDRHHGGNGREEAVPDQGQ